MVENFESEIEKSQKETDGNNHQTSGVGFVLRAARLRLGANLEDIAESLRIRLPYLEAIENADYNKLPGPTYVIGFLKAYSSFLGLDSEEIIRRYKIENTDLRKKSDLVFPTPKVESGVPSIFNMLAGDNFFIT